MNPVFIGGAGRSGTTLLVDLLGTHRWLSPVYETDFVLTLLRELSSHESFRVRSLRIRRWMDVWTRSLPRRPHNKREHERYLHGPHYLLFERGEAMAATEAMLARAEVDPFGALRELATELFASHTLRDGKPRWVNKTPGYVSALPGLKRSFPDLRFVHCVRDGRDVATSVLTRPWGPNTLEEAPGWWAGQVMPGLEFEAEFPEQVLRVRYEDLLTAPVPTLAGVLGFIGEDPDSAKSVVAKYISAGHGLDPGRVGGWREAMSPAEDAKFRAAAGPLLEGLGYVESVAA